MGKSHVQLHCQPSTLVFAISFLIAFSQAAIADVLTFDDLGTIEDSNPIPNGYGGLDTWGMWWLDSSVPGHNGDGFQNGTVSGTKVAFNVFGGITSVSHGGTFDFTGAYLTGAYHNGLNITVTGLLAATTIYSQTVVVDTDGPTWFDFNYLGIDTLSFQPSGGTAAKPEWEAFGPYFALDNFTFTIPEPSSLRLFGIGIVGLIVAVRRRRAANYFIRRSHRC